MCSNEGEVHSTKITYLLPNHWDAFQPYLSAPTSVLTVLPTHAGASTSVGGATLFKHLRTTDGDECDIFLTACIKLGPREDNREMDRPGWGPPF